MLSRNEATGVLPFLSPKTEFFFDDIEYIRCETEPLSDYCYSAEYFISEKLYDYFRTRAHLSCDYYDWYEMDWLKPYFRSSEIPESEIMDINSLRAEKYHRTFYNCTTDSYERSGSTYTCEVDMSHIVLLYDDSSVTNDTLWKVSVDVTTDGFFISEIEKTEERIIKEIVTTEVPLSEIKTKETDWFASCYNSDAPFVDENGNMYYYLADEDTLHLPLFRDNGNDQPVYTGLFDMDAFSYVTPQNGKIYAMDHRDGIYGDRYIVVFENGELRRLLDTPVMGCYFAREGIYYQQERFIYLMDYNGGKRQVITKIPVSLYSEGNSCKMAVYRNKLWYIFEDVTGMDSPLRDFPLWCYDMTEKTYTYFDRGGFDRINNGFLYWYDDNEESRGLYRTNCEDFTVELVSDNEQLNRFSYCFFDNSIYYLDYDNLYRLNDSGHTAIFTPGKLRDMEYISTVSTTGGKLYVSARRGFLHTCMAEIDKDGNIISVIYEDGENLE